MKPTEGVWLVFAFAFLSIACSTCAILNAHTLLQQGTPLSTDKPQVKHVCAVAPDMLAIEIQSGQFTPNQLVRYTPQPGDELVEDKERPHREIVNGNDPTYARLKQRDGWPPFLTDLKNKRATAAVELLAATRNPAYDAVFQQSCTLLTEDTLYHDPEQVDAAFAYARLPQGLGSPEVKRKLTAQITRCADYAIEFSKKNAYDLVVGTRLDYPLIAPLRFFSTPGAGGFLLIYAYELTRNPKYLVAPDWYDGPVYEQYIDFGRYPLHNETCFNQTTVKAACYWFWLHSRPKTTP